MHKIHRDGLDISIAFSSAAKKLAAKVPQPSPLEIDALSPESEGGMGEHSAGESLAISPRTKIKSLLRKIAQYGYRFFKPVLRPIAFRARRYLIEGLRQEVLQNVEGLRQEVLQEIQRSSASAVQKVQNINEGILPRLSRIEQYSCATARRIAINCNSGEVLVRTEIGFVLCAASDHALLSSLLENGELEPGTRLFIEKFLRPGDVYVDVGANIGMHTLAAARAMQGQGRIFAFEPFEPTCRMLEKSVWMNGFSNITEIHQAAVSNVSGCQNLYLGATSGHHSLFELDTSINLSQSPVEVPLVRLDAILDPSQRIDLLKIDAEGAEHEVVEGGASLISDNPDIALIVEFCPSHLRRAGRTPKQWLETFAQFGLAYRLISHNSGALESWSLEQLEQVDSVNLFFSREGSLAWNRLA